MKITFVRHGESVANTQNLVCGKIDFDLSPRGVKQSKQLARHFLNLDKSQKIICSPLLRARQTAALVFLNSIITVDENLTELDTGDYSYISYTELYKLEPRFKILGQKGIVFPKGESIYDVDKRVREFLSKIDLLSEEELIVVTHSGVINIFLHALLDIPLLKYPAFTLDNCSLSMVRYDSGLGSWRVEGVNVYGA